MDIDYSSPTRERGISYETLADGTLHIDIRPAGLPGITRRYFIVASRDALDIEQTGQFQDREPRVNSYSGLHQIVA